MDHRIALTISFELSPVRNLEDVGHPRHRELGKGIGGGPWYGLPAVGCGWCGFRVVEGDAHRAAVKCGEVYVCVYMEWVGNRNFCLDSSQG